MAGQMIRRGRDLIREICSTRICFYVIDFNRNKLYYELLLSLQRSIEHEKESIINFLFGCILRLRSC